MLKNALLLGCVSLLLCFSSCDGADRSTLTESNADDQRNESALSQADQQDSTRSSGEDHYYKGNSHYESHDLEAALSEYRLAIANGYDNVELRIQLGTLLTRLGRDDAAIEEYRVGIKYDRKNWRAHWGLALVLLGMHRHGEALEELTISRRLDPNENYDFEMGQALEGLGREREALKHYEAYLAWYGKAWPPYPPRVRDAMERVEVIKTRLSSTKPPPNSN